MKCFATMRGACLLSILLGAPASASILLNISSALSAGDPTELSRLSRSGVPSDWSTTKAYPGVVNPTIAYHYETFAVNVGVANYVQISVDDPNSAIFASAYSGSYLPAAPATNYLGDDGGTGNFTGNQPSFFQIIVPINGNLVVLVNDVSTTNGGIGKAFGILVEGFIDSNFDEPPTTTPEPAAILLSSAGIGFLLLIRRRQLRHHQQ